MQQYSTPNVVLLKDNDTVEQMNDAIRLSLKYGLIHKSNRSWVIVPVGAGYLVQGSDDDRGNPEEQPESD